MSTGGFTIQSLQRVRLIDYDRLLVAKFTNQCATPPAFRLVTAKTRGIHEPTIPNGPAVPDRERQCSCSAAH